MKLVGWPSYWKKEEGIIPLDIQEIDFQGSPEELIEISNFLRVAADQLSVSIDSQRDLDIDLQLSDSKDEVKLPISISVVHRSEG